MSEEQKIWPYITVSGMVPHAKMEAAQKAEAIIKYLLGRANPWDFLKEITDKHQEDTKA